MGVILGLSPSIALKQIDLTVKMGSGAAAGMRPLFWLFLGAHNDPTPSP